MRARQGKGTETSSFLKSGGSATSLQHAMMTAGKMQWIALAMVLGCLMGGLSAISSQCKSSSSTGAVPTSESFNELELRRKIMALEAQINELKILNKQFIDTATSETSVENMALSSSNSMSSLSVPQVVVRDTSDYVAERTEYDVELKEVLEKLPMGSNGRKEVLIAVSNKALINADGTYGMLATWIEQVKLSGVKNAMVVCLDDDIVGAMKAINFPYWKFKAKNKNKDQAQDNHGISGLKYVILREFLILGYSVLLSDVDIVTLKNPFDYLEHDSDVEGMTDGFDETAYMKLVGVTDASMGWSQYAQSWQIFSMNSGLFYLRANERTIALMDDVAGRLEKDKIWDQSAYNMGVLLPSSPGYKNAGVSVRIMDYKLFMNTKYLFKILRHNFREMSKISPVMVHANYHPDKWERLKAIIKWIRNGDTRALDPFPDGSCYHPPKCKPN